MFQINESDPTSNIIKQKREEFRQEIRRKNVETLFNQKRQMSQFSSAQNFEQLNVGLDELIPNLKLFLEKKDIVKVHQLHGAALRFTADESDKIRNKNIEFLIQNDYIKVAVETLKDQRFRNAFGEVFKTLANTCFSQLFYLQDQLMIKQVLDLAYQQLFDQPILNQSLSDLLVFVGNVADQSLEICEGFMRTQVLLRLIEIAKVLKQEINALKNICYCLQVFARVLDENKKLTLEQVIKIDLDYFSLQKILGIRLLVEIMNASGSDLIHYEILCPFSFLYQANEEIDNTLLSHNGLSFILGTNNGEYVDVTLMVVKKISLSDNQLIANGLIDNGCLNILQQGMTKKNMKIRSNSYLILSNLCYNQAQTIGKIVSHSIINRVFNVLVNENLKERSYALSCILNLLAAGDDVLYKKLIDLGLVQLLCCLMDIDDNKLLLQLLEALKYLANFGREIQQKEELEGNPIIEKYNQFNVVQQLEQLFQNKSIDIQKSTQELLLYFEKN